MKTTLFIFILCVFSQLNMLQTSFYDTNHLMINQMKPHLVKRELYGSEKLLNKMVTLKKEQEERRKHMKFNQSRNKLLKLLANRGNF
jgi:hypothetical protein